MICCAGLFRQVCGQRVRNEGSISTEHNLRQLGLAQAPDLSVFLPEQWALQTVPGVWQAA